MSQILHGTVKWFKEDKGFGFIQCNGCDYFVHYSSIKGSGFKSLLKGAKVSFVPQPGKKGMQASDVVHIK